MGYKGRVYGVNRGPEEEEREVGEGDKGGSDPH